MSDYSIYYEGRLWFLGVVVTWSHAMRVLDGTVGIVVVGEDLLAFDRYIVEVLDVVKVALIPVNAFGSVLEAAVLA